MFTDDFGGVGKQRSSETSKNKTMKTLVGEVIKKNYIINKLLVEKIVVRLKSWCLFDTQGFMHNGLKRGS